MPPLYHGSPAGLRGQILPAESAPPPLEVAPAARWETLSVRWFLAGQLPDGLHPGFTAAWPRLRELTGASA